MLGDLVKRQIRVACEEISKEGTMNDRIEPAIELMKDFYHYLTNDWVIGLSFLLTLISTICSTAIVIMYLLGVVE